ncbi:MAG: ChbG/HpnK family deacetylase [Desulfovibrio sp.]|jgi:predicted glycoside hydrolase/deacetylase ChbG (UPF0249 family)|nr:ChbG/HpnK family deacetylase [Desulfovibrio sp.]
MRCLPLADDCGVSPANVRSILECVEAGALRGTSLLATGAALEEAAALLGPKAAADPDLRLGVHLNLLEGFSSAPPSEIPLLADAGGRFRHSLFSLCAALALASPARRAAFADQAAREWQAQVDRVLGALARAAPGVRLVPYLDGHMHVHALPGLRPALERILKNNAVRHVRVPEEPRYACSAPFAGWAAGLARRELLAAWGRSLRRFLADLGLPAPEFFLGAFASGRMTGQILASGLDRVRALAREEESVEIMFHPGGYSEEERRLPAGAGGQGKNHLFSVAYYAKKEREEEKKLLLSEEYRALLAACDPSWPRPPASISRQGFAGKSLQSGPSFQS